MHVAIHGHRGANFVVALQAADGHGYIVNHAEPLAVVGKGVMKASANVDRDAISDTCCMYSFSITSGQYGFPPLVLDSAEPIIGLPVTKKSAPETIASVGVTILF